MSFDPNQLLNNPAAMLGPLAGRPTPSGAAENKAPVAPPPFDETMYVNAYGRLGMLSIDNVVDLGCGQGNFVSVMTSRGMRPEMYLGVDSSHKQISVAKAAYPGWNFLYGDFTHAKVRAEYERYGAFLMLNLIDTLEDDLEFLRSLPEGKPLIFSMPKSEQPGSLRFYPEGRDIYDRYSSLLSIRSVGRFKSADGSQWSMILASRW